MKPTVSLIIATYNWKEALRSSLLSAFSQTMLPTEIIIADDGSREDTREMINQIRSFSPVPLLHVWHEDKGFRLSAIRNKAIAQAKGDYIIQIDGDIILNRYFIADHLEVAEKGCFVCGSRINLNLDLSKQVMNGVKGVGQLPRYELNSMRIRFLRHYLAHRYGQNNIMRLRGCNMAFWKEDLIRINGYNEAFAYWGHEDSELACRLLFAGVHKKFLKMGGVAYHLWHNQASREGAEQQLATLKERMASGISWVENGLDKYITVYA